LEISVYTFNDISEELFKFWMDIVHDFISFRYANFKICFKTYSKLGCMFTSALIIFFIYHYSCPTHYFDKGFRSMSLNGLTFELSRRPLEIQQLLAVHGRLE
jgi:hypothetical protein